MKKVLVTHHPTKVRLRRDKLNDVIFHFPFTNDTTINILPVAVRQGYREDEAAKYGLL